MSTVCFFFRFCISFHSLASFHGKHQTHNSTHPPRAASILNFNAIFKILSPESFEMNGEVFPCAGEMPRTRLEHIFFNELEKVLNFTLYCSTHTHNGCTIPECSLTLCAKLPSKNYFIESTITFADGSWEKLSLRFFNKQE